MGTMVTATGTTGRAARFTVTTSTDKMSNSKPTMGSWVGHAAGILVVYLLDPPHALQGDQGLTITVMARVDMTVYNPMPGFLAWADEEKPSPTPQGGTLQQKVSSVGGTIPANNHTGTAWLAGGMYWQLVSGSTWSTDLTGELWVYAVYTSSHHPYNWENNDKAKFDPRYLVTWHEPSSGVIQMVGFVNYATAQAQAAGHTGMVPHGAELALQYQDLSSDRCGGR